MDLAREEIVPGGFSESIRANRAISSNNNTIQRDESDGRTPNVRMLPSAARVRTIFLAYPLTEFSTGWIRGQ